MTRRMSCSMTIDAVRDQTKTVTRRDPGTWKNLQPGDRLTLVEKAMGLPRGTKQVVLAEVEVEAAQIVTLGDMTPAECAREGFPQMTPVEFAKFWCDAHHVECVSVDDMLATPVRRIQWRYLP